MSLVFSHGSDLSIVSASGGSEGGSEGGRRLLRLSSAPEDVEVLVSAGMVFWVDSARSVIYRSKMEDGVRKVVIPQGVGGDSIAVDWVSSNLFVANRDRNTITLTSLDGALQKTVITTANNPSCIRVIPEKALLIWTETGASPRLVSSAMDGSRVSVILENPVFVRSPRDLAVDYVHNRVYCIDEDLKHIASVDIDGSDPSIVKR